MKKINVFIFLVLLSFNASYGQSMDGITLQDAVTSKSVDVGSLVKGKGLVIIFHSLGCPFAKMYEARIIDLRTRFQSQGFTFILVNPESDPGENEASLRAYIDESGVNMPYLMDKDKVLARHLKISKIPEVLLITPGNSTSATVYRGAIDNNPQAAASVTEKFLEKALNQVLKGESPTPAQARAVGCNVRTF